MDKPIRITLKEKEGKRLEELKEHYGARTNSEIIRRLILDHKI